MPVYSTSANSLKTILNTVFGADQEATRQFCRRIDLCPQELAHPTRPYGPSLAEKSWRELSRLLGSAHPGLVIGRQLPLTMGGLVNQLVRVAPTLRRAIEHIAQHFERVISSAPYERLNVYEEKGFLILELSPVPSVYRQYPFATQQNAECFFTGFLNVLGQLAPQPIRPVKLEWMGPEPSHLELHKTVFGAPMTFGHTSNKLFLGAREMDVATRNADPVLYRHFQQLLPQFSATPRTESFADTVRNSLLRRLNQYQSISADVVADELGLSVRSVQRRLESEQTSFQRIAEEARKEVALRLIQTGQHNFNEVSCLVGYDEPSSFRRAFKRWTGQKPSAFVSSRSQTALN